MATLNISDKQKQRVVALQKLIDHQMAFKISQADVVDMGMALLEKEYSTK